eukprot:1324241-Rhodomonas_salina.1
MGERAYAATGGSADVGVRCYVWLLIWCYGTGCTRTLHRARTTYERSVLQPIALRMPSTPEVSTKMFESVQEKMQALLDKCIVPYSHRPYDPINNVHLLCVCSYRYKAERMLKRYGPTASWVSSYTMVQRDPVYAAMLCCYEASTTDNSTHYPTERECDGGGRRGGRSAPLWCYAFATRCPVLTSRMLLPAGGGKGKSKSMQQ